MELKRKIYDDLRRWKERAGHKPLIVEGLRQVGKSYIVQKFERKITIRRLPLTSGTKQS